MKRLTATLLVGLLTSSLIFTGCGKKESSKAEEADGPILEDDDDSSNAESVAGLGSSHHETREDADGWDESKNIQYKVHNLTFSIPSYAKEEDTGLYQFEGNKEQDAVNFAVMTVDDAPGIIYMSDQEDYGVTENSIKNFYDSYAPQMAEQFDATANGNYTTSAVGPYKICRFGLKSDDLDIPVTVIFNGDYGETVICMMMQRNDSKKNYKSDYQKIVSSVQYEEPPITSETKSICDAYVETAQTNTYDKTVIANMDNLDKKVDTLPEPDQHYVWMSHYKVGEIQNQQRSGN